MATPALIRGIFLIFLRFDRYIKTLYKYAYFSFDVGTMQQSRNIISCYANINVLKISNYWSTYLNLFYS